MTQPPDAYTQSLREQHRADPLAFFDRLLREFFMNRDNDQTLRKWQTVISENRWYAEDVVACMATILVQPPDDFVERVRENGWVILPHSDDLDAISVLALYLDWLEKSLAQFHTFLK